MGEQAAEASRAERTLRYVSTARPKNNELTHYTPDSIRKLASNRQDL